MPLTPAQVLELRPALGDPAYSRLVLCPPTVGLWTPRWAAVICRRLGGLLLAVPADEQLAEFLRANAEALDEAGRTPHPFGASVDVTVAARVLDDTVRADELILSATLVDVSAGAYRLLHLAAPLAPTPLGADGVLSFQPEYGDEAPEEEGGW